MSLANAASFVAPGGTLVMLAECREGLGPDDFREWMETINRGTLYCELRVRCTNVGYVVFLAHESCSARHVVLVSSLDQVVPRTMGIEGVRTVHEACRIAGVEDYRGRVLIIPEARMTVPRATQ